MIPLGHQPKRLDCSELYALEVERLKMELRLMQMGLGNQGKPADTTETASISTAPDASEDVDVADEPVGGQIKGSKAKIAEVVPAKKSSNSKDWADEGWTTKGKK